MGGMSRLSVSQSYQVVIRNESEILNVGMSKPPKVAEQTSWVSNWRCKPHGGVQGGAPVKKMCE